MEYPQQLLSEDLTHRTIARRAVEAVIWGMPAVNTDVMLQEMLTKTKGRVNQILYWSRPLDWQNQTLTPNPDSIYFMAFFNTKDAGPIVLEVPPADGGSLAGNIVTLWQASLEDVGPEGLDNGQGGKYLILPPGYTDKPPAGYYVLQCDTFTGYALLRSNLISHSNADIARSVEYGKRTRIYPLAQAASPPETIFTDASDVFFDATIPYDLRFFKSLDRVVQSDHWIQRDRSMIDQLRSIGIEKGMPFDPDAIRALAAVLNETGLTEIEIAEKDSRIRVVRASAAPPLAVAAPALAPPVAIPPGPSPEETTPAGAVLSPMVGVAYLAPEPGASPFITVGQSVTAGQTLLLIEAMKTFNQIKAPKSGTITRILVTNSTPVEYGEVLLILE